MLPSLRGVFGWALLMTATAVGRDALDWWLAPTQDFYARSIVSTALAGAIYVGAGAWGASRLRSVGAGWLSARLLDSRAAQ